jgi:hypothetical protein
MMFPVWRGIWLKGLKLGCVVYYYTPTVQRWYLWK